VLLSTRHKWTHTTSTPPRQAGTQLTFPEGIEGWVDLGDDRASDSISRPCARYKWFYCIVLYCYTPRWFTYPQTVIHPSTNPAGSWFQLASYWLQVWRPNHYTTKPPRVFDPKISFPPKKCGWLVATCLVIIILHIICEFVVCRDIVRLLLRFVRRLLWSERVYRLWVRVRPPLRWWHRDFAR